MFGTGRNRSPAVVLAAILAMGGAVSAAAGGRFSFSLSAEALGHRPPEVEQRLAVWDSPMGRVAAAVADAQGVLGMSGLVGRPHAVVLAIGYCPRLRPELIAGSIASGMAPRPETFQPIPWPWEPRDGQRLSLEEEIAVHLGRRLELH